MRTEYDAFPSSGPSTKDCMHLKRMKGLSSPAVHLLPENKLSMTKEVFLRNNKNKDRFIHLVGIELAADECKVLYADSDADTLIIRTAIQQSNNENTCIVGNDTDLLILLLNMSLSDSRGCYFKTAKKFGI